MHSRNLRTSARFALAAVCFALISLAQRPAEAHGVSCAYWQSQCGIWGGQFVCQAYQCWESTIHVTGCQCNVPGSPPWPVPGDWCHTDEVCEVLCPPDWPCFA
jgi:hypothetical protein